MTAAHLDRERNGTVDRQAKVKGDSEWHACGNVTMSQAAASLAMWLFDRSEIKSVPKTLPILVRDMDRPDIEFMHEVTVSIDISVKPVRGKDANL